MIRIMIALALLFGFTGCIVAQELSVSEQKILDAAVARHKKNTECDTIDVEIPNNEFIRFKKNSDYESDTIVVLVACSYHAYQVTWVAYSAYDDGGEPEISVVSFPTTEDGKQWIATNFLMTPDWDQKTKTLNTFTKGRGMADCGNYKTYRWNGYAFYITKVNSQACCWNIDDFETRPECKKIKDIYPIPDYEWPLVYKYSGKK